MSATISSSHRSGHSRRRRQRSKSDDDASTPRGARFIAGVLGLLLLALLASLGVIAANIGG